MAKDKTEAEIAAKKEKKDKKRKLEEVEDVEAVTPKKEKKKKRKSEAAAENDESVMDVDGQSLVKVEEADDKKDEKAVVAVPLAALVPFANPLADEKAQKKVLKTVKKGTLHLSLTRRLPGRHANIGFCSRKVQITQTRCQRMRQVDPQITSSDARLTEPQHPPTRHRHSRRRHLTYGRHQPHPCTLRGPQHSLHLRSISCRAGRGRKHQATNKCSHVDAECWRKEG